MSDDKSVREVVGRLEAERAVRQTILTLNQAYDDEEWHTVRACLSDDFTGSSNPPVPGAATSVGPDVLLNGMRAIAAQTPGVKTMHVPGDMIVMASGDQAQASGFYTAYRYYDREGEFSHPRSKSGGRFTYYLRREDGAWRIVSFNVVRLWLEGEY
jgi:hypothetical protein